MPKTPEFADWLAIANLKAAYCRLLDTKDWQGWGELWAEDMGSWRLSHGVHTWATGGGVIAFSDGTNWRRVTDRAVIS